MEREWVGADLSEKILSIVERAGLKVVRGVPADCGGMLLVQDTVGRHLVLALCGRGEITAAHSMD